MADTFMKQHPDIPVKVLVIPASGYGEKITTMIGGGVPPDIFTTGETVIPEVVGNNFNVDLNSLVEKENYDLSDFYPEVIEGLTFDGQLVGLTDNWDTQVMYYNKDLFDQAGLDYPDESWTWDDFKVAARELTSGEGSDKVYGAIFDTWFPPLYDQVWSFGGEVFNEEGTECALDTPSSMKAIEFIRTLFAEGLSPSPTQLRQAGQSSVQTFLSGRAAMWIGNGRWTSYELADVEEFDWAIAPVPEGPAGRANFLHISTFVISKTSDNIDGAWEFLKFMVSEQGIQLTLGNFQGIPSRKSLAVSSAVRNDPLVQEHNSLKPFLQSLPTAHAANFPTGWGPAQDILDAEMDPIWTGEKTPAEWLPEVCDQVDEALAEAREEA